MKKLFDINDMKTSEESRSCQYHGDYITSILYVNNKTIESSCPICLENQKIKEQIEERNQTKLDYQLAQIAKCGGDNFELDVFLSHTFETFIATDDVQKKNLEHAKKIANNFGFLVNQGAQFVFYGVCGVGKTHLSHAILNHLIKKGKNARYTTYLGFEDALAHSMNYDQAAEAEKLLNVLHTIDFLVIDEMPFSIVNRGTLKKEDIERKLLRLIDQRQSQKKPTLMIGNYKEVFSYKSSPALYSRIISSGKINKDFSEGIEIENKEKANSVDYRIKRVRKVNHEWECL